MICIIEHMRSCVLYYRCQTCSSDKMSYQPLHLNFKLNPLRRFLEISYYKLRIVISKLRCTYFHILSIGLFSSWLINFRYYWSIRYLLVWRENYLELVGDGSFRRISWDVNGATFASVTVWTNSRSLWLRLY